MLEVVEMPTQIDAYSIADPSKMFKIDVPNPATRFNGGGYEYKRLFVGVIDEVETPLIERTFYTNHALAWLVLREETSISVVPDLMAGSDGMLIAPDLMANGAAIYGKSMLVVLDDENLELERPRPYIDEIFLDIATAEGFDLIEDKVVESVQSANENGIRLAEDGALDMVVQPDESWDVMALDLRFIRYVDPSIASEKVRRDWRADNGQYGFEFLCNLRTLHQRLRGTSRYFSSPRVHAKV